VVLAAVLGLPGVGLRAFALALRLAFRLAVGFAVGLALRLRLALAFLAAALALPLVRVVGHVPARAFEMEGGGGCQLLDGLAALGALLERRIREAPEQLEAALLRTLVLVQRHAYPPPIVEFSTRPQWTSAQLFPRRASTTSGTLSSSASSI